MRLTLALLAFVAACTPDGPKAKDGADPAVIKDWDNVCNAWTRSNAVSVNDPAQRGTLIAGWLDEHIKTPRVMKVIGSLASMAPEDRRANVAAAAKEDGYLDLCGLSWLPAPK
jgi:hypothetical protein